MSDTIMSNTTNLTYSTGLGTGYGNETLLKNPELCTVETCDLSLATFIYLPTVPGNAIVAGIFGALIFGQLFYGIKYRTWNYMVPMIIGLVLEVVGYIIRVLMHDEPFSGDYFRLNLITLTIAPAFMSAAIYLCLSRIVIIYGAHLSRFKPRTYTVVFVSCDFVSLVFQAIGGAIASGAKEADDLDLGKNLMMVGLGFQVFSLLLFMVAAGEFALRVRSRKSSRVPKYLDLTSSLLFKSFLVGLLVATVTIFVRCVYRCVELSDGFHSELFVSHEEIYMVLEGVMMLIACICLTFFNPGLCFQGAWHEATFSWRDRTPTEGIKMGKLHGGLESQQSTLCDGVLAGETDRNSELNYSNAKAV